MKPIVLKYGLLSGVASSLMMLATVPFLDQIGFEHGELFGYSAIVLSFLFVYFGIRAYRERVLGGRITFLNGVMVGLVITLISCVFYVATWQLIYFHLAPDFFEKYASYAAEKMRAAGAAQAAIDESTRQMAEFKKMYDNPLTNAAITLVEPLPIGLLITLVSAGALRRTRAAG